MFLLLQLCFNILCIILMYISFLLSPHITCRILKLPLDKYTVTSFNLITVILLWTLIAIIFRIVSYFIKIGNIRYIVYPEDGISNIIKCCDRNGRFIFIPFLNYNIRKLISSLAQQYDLTEKFKKLFYIQSNYLYSLGVRTLKESLDNLDECVLALSYKYPELSIKNISCNIIRNFAENEVLFLKSTIKKKVIESILSLSITISVLYNIKDSYSRLGLSAHFFCKLLILMIIYITIKLLISSLMKLVLMNNILKNFISNYNNENV